MMLATLMIPSVSSHDTTTSLDGYIHDDQGNVWTPTSSNLINAVNALPTNGQLWIPAGTFILSRNLYITQNGVQIHGSGQNTRISLQGGKIYAGLYVTSSSTLARYSHGLNNLVLENFCVEGSGSIEIVLGSNIRLQGIYAYNMRSAVPAAFHLVLPTDGTPCYNLKVIDCHTYKTSCHGFQINGIEPNGRNAITNVLFDHCTASYAGWHQSGWASGNWSVGFDFGEGYNKCLLTVTNVVVQNCSADHAWESGFHMESNVKRSLTYNYCKADYNGLKRRAHREYTYYFCSGFIAETGVTLNHCEASCNTNRGVLWRNRAIIHGFAGDGNWHSLT